MYGKDGKEYTGKIDGFLKKAVDAIGFVSKNSATGKALYDQLSSSKNTFNIKTVSENPIAKQDQFISDNYTKSHYSQFQTDPALLTTKNAMQSSGKDYTGGAGGTIYWDAAGSFLPTTAGFTATAATDLAHEASHGSDADRGVEDNREEDGITRDEWQASYRENLIRGEMNLPLRTNYRTSHPEGGTDIIGIPPALLNLNGQPILPSWYKP